MSTSKKTLLWTVWGSILRHSLWIVFFAAVIMMSTFISTLICVGALLTYVCVTPLAVIMSPVWVPIAIIFLSGLLTYRLCWGLRSHGIAHWASETIEVLAPRGDRVVTFFGLVVIHTSDLADLVAGGEEEARRKLDTYLKKSGLELQEREACKLAKLASDFVTWSCANLVFVTEEASRKRLLGAVLEKEKQILAGRRENDTKGALLRRSGLLWWAHDKIDHYRWMTVFKPSAEDI